MSGTFTLTDSGMYDAAGVWKETVTDAEVQKALGLPPEHCQEVAKACDTYRIALEACRADPIPERTHIKNDAKENCRSKITHFANEHIRFNRDAPHDLQIKLGILPADEKKKSSVSFDASPNSEIILNGRKPGVVGVRYLDGKPMARCACQIRWCISPTTPADAESMEAWNEEIFSRNPWEHSFPGKRGQMFHYSIRWILLNGEAGEWSEVKSCAIP
jgi:hypothetical protein